MSNVNGIQSSLGGFTISIDGCLNRRWFLSLGRHFGEDLKILVRSLLALVS